MISAITPLIFTSLLLLTNIELEEPIPTAPIVNFFRTEGNWYEIARIDVPWGEACYCTVSSFLPKNEHEVKIVNYCQTSLLTNEIHIENATMWSTGKNNNKLFYQSLWPLRHSLWVVDLDLGYNWMILAIPNKSGLWILSRKPVLEEAVLKRMVEKIILYGFQINKIVYTPQGGECKYPI